MQDHKMKTLDSIIEMMDGHMLGAAKARKKPAIQPPMAAPAEETSTSPAELMEAAAKPEGADEDDDERALMEMYQAIEPTQMTGKN
jgi:hypothetical protein